MNIGRLRERIIILSRKIREDERGDLQETWDKKHNLWACISPITCPHKMVAEGWGGEKISERYTVTTRFCTVKFQRILWKAEIYRVVSPPQGDEKKQWLRFTIERHGEDK